MLPKLVVFDMDGTIVRYENSSFYSSWDAIGEAAGKKAEFETQMKHYYPLTQTAPDYHEVYQEWFEANCKNLTGIPLEQVTSKVFPPPYAPGFQEFSAYLRENRVLQGIISSGVDLVAQRILEENGLDFYIAHEVEIKEGRFTGKGKMVVPLWEKDRFFVEQVRKLAAKYPQRGISLPTTAYFGDHLNDRGCWKRAGLSIGIALKDKDLEMKVDCHFPDFYGALELFKVIR